MSKDTLAREVVSSKRPVHDAVVSVKKVCPDPSQASTGAEGFTFGVLDGSVGSAPNQLVKVIPVPNVVATGGLSSVLSIPEPNVVAPGGQSSILVLPQPNVVAEGGGSLFTGIHMTKDPVSVQSGKGRHDLGLPVPPMVFNPKLVESRISYQCEEIMSSRLKVNEPLRKLGKGMVGAPNSVVGIGWQEFRVDPNAGSNVSVISDVKSAPLVTMVI
jgi:hypothetical protein